MVNSFLDHLAEIEPPEGLERFQKTNEGINLGN